MKTDHLDANPVLTIDSNARPRASKRRPSSVLLILVCLPVGLAFGGWMAASQWDALGPSLSPQKQTQTDHARAGSSEPAPGLVVAGQIVSGHLVRIATKVSGEVAELAVDVGQAVQTGQALARIDEDEYRVLRDMHAARLREVQAQLRKAAYDFRRAEDLRRRQVVADTEWTDAEAALEQAEARVAAAEAALELAGKRLDDCVIKSPFAGVVLVRFVSVGDFVAVEGGRSGQANALVVTVADVNDLRVELDVSERDIARVRPGMRCTIIPDAYDDRRYPGEVLRIDPSGDYAKGTVGVTVRVDSPDEYVRIGCAARVEFSAQ